MKGKSKKTNKKGTQPIDVAAILPAYNEGKTIGKLLEILAPVNLLTEIIVIDDGSKDDSAAIVRSFAKKDRRVRLLQHKRNRGKGEAVFTGIRATKAQIILLLDTDLHGLEAHHVEDLIHPILADQADMTMGLFWGGHVHTDLAQWVTPYLTGQRCLRADLFRKVSRKAASGYGLEVALTAAARQCGYRTRIVPLKGVWHLPSELHRGLDKGVRWRWRMYKQILRAWKITIRQNFTEMKQRFSAN